MKSSIHNWTVLDKSGVYAPTVGPLTAGDLRGVLQGLRAEEASLTAPQQSAEGIVGMQARAEGLNGGEESWPEVER